MKFVPFNGVYVGESDVGDVLTATATGYQYQTTDDSVETYDATGYLLSIARRGQPLITVQYSSNGTVTDNFPAVVSDPFGHALTFAYARDPSGSQRLASVTDPSGNQVQYTYNSYGDVITAAFPDGKTRQFAYGAEYHVALITLTDESGTQFATWTYSASGGTVLTSRLAGGVDSYTFSTSGTDHTVVDPLGQSRTYGTKLIAGLFHLTASTTTSGTMTRTPAGTSNQTRSVLPARSTRMHMSAAIRSAGGTSHDQ